MQSRRNNILFSLLSILLLGMIYFIFPVYNNIRNYVGNTFLTQYFLVYIFYIVLTSIIMVIYIGFSRKMQSKSAWIMKCVSIVVLILYAKNKFVWYSVSDCYIVFTTMIIGNFIIELVDYIKLKKKQVG